MTKKDFKQSAVPPSADDLTRWVFFKASPDKKTQGLVVPAHIAIAEVESKIAEISETPVGSIAYWLAEPGQDKDTAWQAARAAKLRYLTPEEIEAFRTYLPHMLMNDILLDLKKSEAEAARHMANTLK